MVFPSLVLLCIGAFETLPPPRDADPDSLKIQVASLAKEGKLDAALALVESANPIFPAPFTQLLRGKLELPGEASRRAYEAASKDSNTDSAVGGEALIRLGQFYYAADQHHYAIPQFREYLRRYPSGPWADPAAYWMGYSCLEFARQHPGKNAYLDSGLSYANTLENRNRPNGFYLSLALEIKIRLLWAKGDTGAAQSLLGELRAHAPAEERPGTLLLSALIPDGGQCSPPPEWGDTLRTRYPKAPESRLPSPVHAPARPIPSKVEAVTPVSSQRFTLQLGAFSQSPNAEQLRLRLAAKGLHARKEEFTSGGKMIFRILYGDYPDAVSAQSDGERLLKPLGYVFQVTPHP